MMGRPRMRRGVPMHRPMTLADVIDRDGPLCPHCGRPATQRQHRANRGMGGSNAAERPSNIIGFCDLNDALERDAALADWARSMGWKVSQHADPSAIPYWDHALQSWVRLGDDGGRTIMGSAPASQEVWDAGADR